MPIQTWVDLFSGGIDVDGGFQEVAEGGSHAGQTRLRGSVDVRRQSSPETTEVRRDQLQVISLAKRCQRSHNPRRLGLVQQIRDRLERRLDLVCELGDDGGRVGGVEGQGEGLCVEQGGGGGRVEADCV